MSISSMKQALDALDCINPPLNVRGMRKLGEAMRTLRQAIAEAEKREWVGLTDEEIKALPSWWPSYDQMPALMRLVRDIESKLRSKNT